MATFKLNEGWTYAALAAVDLTDKQWYFGKIDTAGKIDLAGNGGVVAGIIYEADVAAKPVTLYWGASGKVIVGTAVTAGDQIASDANGKAKPALTTNFVVGIALESGAAGTIIEFMFVSGYKP